MSVYICACSHFIYVHMCAVKSILERQSVEKSVYAFFSFAQKYFCITTQDKPKQPTSSFFFLFFFLLFICFLFIFKFLSFLVRTLAFWSLQGSICCQDDSMHSVGIMEGTGKLRKLIFTKDSSLAYFEPTRYDLTIQKTKYFFFRQITVTETSHCWQIMIKLHLLKQDSILPWKALLRLPPSQSPSPHRL